jgi:hypothetical protein
LANERSVAWGDLYLSLDVNCIRQSGGNGTYVDFARYGNDILS